MAYERRRWDKEKEDGWNAVQMVHPGETFPLFHLARNGTTIRSTDDGSFGGMASRIRLHTGFIDPLNLSIVAAPYVLPRAEVITPFNPTLGYPLDQEDFSWRSRYKKISSMKDELAEMVEGLGLVVFASYAELPFYQMMRAVREEGSPPLAPEIAFLLKRVFLTLTFASGPSFTAQAVYQSSQLFLLFSTFFPTDTGPLPVGAAISTELESVSAAEGFRVLLPFNVEQVQTLQAKFRVLADLDE
jgi:hypothetical protein